jgi:putative resolvase
MLGSLLQPEKMIRSYAKDKGCGGVQILSDVGSGLDEDRRGFLRLLGMVTERKVIIVYEDRLARFGFETLRMVFQVFGAAIEVINSEEKTPQEELVEDLITIVSHFAGELYGMRPHRYKEVVEGVRNLLSG